MAELIGRRGLLGGAVLTVLGAAACSTTEGTATPTATPVTTPATTPGASQTSISTKVFANIEKSYDARLGLYALDTASGRSVAYRADERFAMCSTFKLLAVGALLKRVGTGGLDEKISYVRQNELVANSPITEKHSSMTLGALCAAALRYSDNTAANLILAQIGGPKGVTRFARTLGDQVTRLDRNEPGLNEATPGDQRDTSTPQDLGTDLYGLLHGATLTETARRQLKTWMLGNTTGDDRIRSVVPKGWKVADKTGTGAYGTVNDVAVLYPSGDREPIVLSILAGQEDENANGDEQLVADAAEQALAKLGH